MVADLLHVVRAFRLVDGLEGHHLSERGLGALDLRGDDRLLADEPVQEPVRVGDHRTGDAQAGHGGGGIGVLGGQFSFERSLGLDRSSHWPGS